MTMDQALVLSSSRHKKIGHRQAGEEAVCFGEPRKEPRAMEICLYTLSEMSVPGFAEPRGRPIDYNSRCGTRGRLGGDALPVLSQQAVAAICAFRRSSGEGV